MVDKIEKDVKEVDEELENEENFELDEEEKDFKDYDKSTKPSVFSRMWNGVKNVFSSDDEDDEDKESSNEDDDSSDEEDEDHDDNHENNNETVVKKADVESKESKPAVSKPLQNSVKSDDEKKIHLNDIKDSDDMGKLIKISVGILERLPQNEFEKFKQSDDFLAYKDIVKKYKKKN